MKLTLPRLSIQKGSSISTSIPITLDKNETLTGYRASAYIKARMSDDRIVCVMDAKISGGENIVNVSVLPPRCNLIPAGQFVYYVELIQGLTNKIVQRNYLNVEP